MNRIKILASEFSKISECIVSTSLKIRVNVMQSVYLVRSALPYLNSSQGTIAVMSSASGKIACECIYVCMYECMYECTQREQRV